MAVVAVRVGVVASRRRDDLSWVLPTATMAPGETSAQAAVRVCKEQTGLAVRVEREIGRGRRPVAGQEVIYLECITTTCAALRAPLVDDLDEVRWLDRYQVDELIRDLPHVVRCFLQLRYIAQPDYR